MGLPTPSCLRKCVCQTILEHLSQSISACPKCAPIIYERRRSFDMKLIQENRTLTREEAEFIVGYKTESCENKAQSSEKQNNTLKQSYALGLPTPSCLRKCVCQTILEHLSRSISACPKCAPIINERRRSFDMKLIQENRTLTREEVEFIVGCEKITKQ